VGRSDFYVYSYWHKGRPVYVGKGSGPRDKAHLGAFEKRYCLTVERIHTHAQHLTQAAAYAAEFQLVNKFGRKGVDPGGTLLNAAPGGSRAMRPWAFYRP
jgi:hypothetical protein